MIKKKAALEKSNAAFFIESKAKGCRKIWVLFLYSAVR